MLTTILILVLAWTIIGGAWGIWDCNAHNIRGPKVWYLWVLLYGPAFWVALGFSLLCDAWLYLLCYLDSKARS